VTRPGTIAWFAGHELRLAWRDLLALITAGRRRRIRTVVLLGLLFALFLHMLAYQMLASSGNLSGPPDPHLLIVITGTLLMGWSLMLSQAMESVTRAFYARGDLELILTSPAAVSRLFAVRIVAMALTIMGMSLVLGAPLINMLVWLGGTRWLGAYGVVLALAMDSVAVAALIAMALFHAIGPRRTRTVAQIVSAVIGAAFAIGMQITAILSFGNLRRMEVLNMPALVRHAPGGGSLLWWPAHAVLSHPLALAALLGLSAAALAGAIAAVAPRFGPLALAAAAAAQVTTRRSTRPPALWQPATPGQALRRKEWTLLLRDPWLMSQTLMQLLYLLPPIFLLWRSFYAGGGAAALLVPILIITAGQLAGGLAWLAVSGEDAPELIATAPVSTARVLRAKTEAVFGGVAMVFGPFVVVLAMAAVVPALVAVVGVLVAAGSATAIQFWFRTQSRRSLFRRRQTSSRIATFAEALSSIGWAGTGAVAASGSWLALVPAVFVLLLLAGVWAVSPSRSAALA
jgi:ABC-2 type transport system permease protein